MFTKQQGFSLIELIFAIVIVYAGVAGIMAVMGQAVRSSADPVAPKQAIMVAEALMEEILSKSFADSGVGGSSRADWDDVNDYNGYGTVGIKDASGNPIAGLDQYNVSVSVGQPAASVGMVAVGEIRQVTITVSVGGDTYSLTGYRFNND